MRGETKLGPGELRILILNKAFWPDVVSSAQHATDLAVELARQGHRVTALASARGYDDPKLKFPPSDNYKGVEIMRVRGTGFGRSGRWRRVLDFLTFLWACARRMVALPRVDVIVALTSPPLISVLAALAIPWKAKRLVVWSMDLNPDQAIAAGWLRAGSVIAGILQGLWQFSLQRAERIVALDRYMKERITARGIAAEKVAVIPPWSQDDAVRFDQRGRRAFRSRHGLTGKFVVMYSGNHSPCHPLDTLICAAQRLAEREEFVFCFIGGGSEHRHIMEYAEQRRLKNVVCLPYQPLDGLSASLSAADLHVIVMGEPFTGLVHPCKIYNILAVGAPFLYIGPEKSHVADITALAGDASSMYVAGHGEVDRVVAHVVRAALRKTVASLEHRELASIFSKRVLLPLMVRAVTSLDSLPDRELPGVEAKAAEVRRTECIDQTP